MGFNNFIGHSASLYSLVGLSSLCCPHPQPCLGLTSIVARPVDERPRTIRKDGKVRRAKVFNLGRLGNIGPEYVFVGHVG